MSKYGQVLDHDPESKTTTYHKYDPVEDETIITEIQDIEPFLKGANELRKDDDYSKTGIKKEMWHYARVPNSIIMRMKLEDGVDFYSPHQRKEMMRLINTKYAFCKTTRGFHDK